MLCGSRRGCRCSFGWLVHRARRLITTIANVVQVALCSRRFNPKIASHCSSPFFISVEDCGFLMSFVLDPQSFAICGFLRSQISTRQPFILFMACFSSDPHCASRTCTPVCLRHKFHFVSIGAGTYVFADAQGLHFKVSCIFFVLTFSNLAGSSLRPSLRVPICGRLSRFLSSGSGRCG